MASQLLERRTQLNADYYAKYDGRVIDPKWDQVDSYLTRKLVPEAVEDSVLAAAYEDNDLPRISVNPTNGKLLYLLALSSGAKRILEIGTLAGYSTIWLAKALKGRTNSKVVTLEFEEKHAKVARENIQKAGFEDLVDVVVGDAQVSCQKLIHNGDQFDFIFIDADKPAYPAYLKLCMQLAHPGTLIIADNIVRQGAVANPDSADDKVKGAQQYIDMLSELAAQGKVTSTAMQTVDAKGHDGFAMTVVL